MDPKKILLFKNTLQKSSKKFEILQKKTQKYSIFDQILEFLNQNWPFSHWMENLMKFRKFLKLRGRVMWKIVWVWFRRDFHDSNLFKIIQIYSWSSRIIIFNHDFESNRPCNWIRVSCRVVRDRLSACHEINQKALIESRNAFELFLISSDPIRSKSWSQTIDPDRSHAEISNLIKIFLSNQNHEWVSNLIPKKPKSSNLEKLLWSSCSSVQSSAIIEKRESPCKVWNPLASLCMIHIKFTYEI